jgi:hypothetical protein
MIVRFAKFHPIFGLLPIHNHLPQSQIAGIPQSVDLLLVLPLLFLLVVVVDGEFLFIEEGVFASGWLTHGVEDAARGEGLLHWLVLVLSGTQVLLFFVEFEDVLHVLVGGYFGVHEFEKVDVVLVYQ